MIGQGVGLREVGVKLDLVDAGILPRLFPQALQVFGQEVADADGSHEPASARIQQSLEGLDVQAPRGVGPVDQVHVPVVQPGAHQRFLDGFARLLVALVAAGELGDEAKLLAGEPAPARRLPHGPLVLVVEGAIEHPVAGLDP